MISKMAAAAPRAAENACIFGAALPSENAPVMTQYNTCTHDRDGWVLTVTQSIENINKIVGRINL